MARVACKDIILLYRLIYSIDVSYLFRGIESVGMWRSPTSGLIFFDPPVTGDDRFYQRLGQLGWYYQEEKTEFAFALERLPHAGRILEVGCGPGFFGKRLPEGVRYVGLETNPDALARAVAAGLDARNVLVEALAEQEPGAFDAVVSFQVLEHVANPAGFLAACVRALRPGGVLVISVPSADGFLRHTVNDMMNVPPHHVTRWSDACLAWCAASFGLDMQVLHKQRLSDSPHREWYCRTLINRALLSLAGVDLSGPVTTHPLWFAVHPLAKLLSKVLQHGFAGPAMEPYGHTAVAVMRKPA